MRSLSASDLLQAWETALGCPAAERGVALLDVCAGQFPGTSSSIGIGERDARLLHLYEVLFGSALHAFAECPACQGRLEYTLTSSDLVPPTSFHLESAAVEADGFSLRLRLLDCSDLHAAAQCPDEATARRVLFESSMVEASRDGEPVSLHDVPSSLIPLVEDCLTAIDPRLEMLIHLSCSFCGHTWQVLFDPDRFLWAKVGALAKRLLREVHTLASAYGWSEESILNLTAQRRQAYLELADA